MTPSPTAVRAVANGMATGHELNEELTIILGSVDLLMQIDLDSPDRLLLLDIKEAAERCKVSAGGLLEYGKARGVRVHAPVAARAWNDDESGCPFDQD